MTNAPSTDKYLNDLKPTVYQVLDDNYLEQVTATLNYRLNHIDPLFGSVGLINSTNMELYSKSGDIEYILKNVGDNYTLVEEDLDGRTIIRINATKDTTINIPTNIATDAFIGKAVNLYNVFDYFVDIVPLDHVIINANDSSLLRRSGSSVTLVYVGNNEWDMYGELA